MTKAAVDISGRPFLVWNVNFSAPKIGTFDTELVREFFQALAQNAGITLHILNHYGANNHHIAETCFKAVARVLRAATEIDPGRQAAFPRQRVCWPDRQSCQEAHDKLSRSGSPNGPDRDHKTTRFIADRFVWLALIAPRLWLAVNRLWLAAIVVFAVLVLAGWASMLPGFEPVGILCSVAIALITALEGRDFLVRHLIGKGWKMTSVISAPDLSSAEEIYFSDLSENTEPSGQLSQPVWTPSPQKSGDKTSSTIPPDRFFSTNGRR